MDLLEWLPSSSRLALSFWPAGLADVDFGVGPTCRLGCALHVEKVILIVDVKEMPSFTRRYRDPWRKRKESFFCFLVCKYFPPKGRSSRVTLTHTSLMRGLLNSVVAWIRHNDLAYYFTFGSPLCSILKMDDFQIDYLEKGAIFVNGGYFNSQLLNQQSDRNGRTGKKEVSRRLAKCNRRSWSGCLLLFKRCHT